MFLAQVLEWLPPLVSLCLILIVSRWYLYPAPARPTRSVALLVLGDLGRSPRMMFHAQSFAEHGFQTTLIGYAGSALLPSLLSLPNFHVRHIPVHLSAFAKAPRVFFPIIAPIKVLLQAWSILKILTWDMDVPPEFLVVQNPPSIPTLMLAQLICRARGSAVIIDWHNLGYSILALKLGQNHPLVKIARKFESFFGRSAWAHLFVTKAMKKWLTENWKLEGEKVVLHDRSPPHFHRSDPAEIHHLFSRLTPQFPSSLHHLFPPNPTPTPTPTSSAPHPSPTPFTSFEPRYSPLSSSSNFVPVLRPDRPAILISSTSWTPDEDFSILLEALSLYNKTASAAAGEEGDKGMGDGQRKLPKVLCVISGKGPMREAFEREVEKRRKVEGWEFVGVWCCWVEVEDYPKLLGSADLGVSLHSSSSALDLPMKIVDMFGCGLPVCSLGFACLDELVEDGKNGVVFSDASQLAGQMTTLLAEFPSPAPGTPLGLMRKELEDRRAEWGDWSENWTRVVKPLVILGNGHGITPRGH